MEKLRKVLPLPEKVQKGMSVDLFQICGFDRACNSRPENNHSKLSDRESCVIIGRSADYILKEHKPILRIFIYSPDEVRIKNVMESHNLSEDDAKLFIMEKTSDITNVIWR